MTIFDMNNVVPMSLSVPVTPSSLMALSNDLANKKMSASVAESPSPPPSKYVYHDYSCVAPDDGESIMDAFTSTSVAPSNIKRQKLPVKLNAMLSDPLFTHIISWMPHGRSWRILKPKAFVREVLPNYFEYCNYNSFVRLVNAWGFRRFTSGPDRHCYYHELFLRGLPHLHNKMRRITGKDKKPPVDQDDEPDLYSISRIFPLPPTRQQQQGVGLPAQVSSGANCPVASFGSLQQSSVLGLLRDDKLLGSTTTLAESIPQVLESNKLVAQAQAQALANALLRSRSPPQRQSPWADIDAASLMSLSQFATPRQQQQQRLLAQGFQTQAAGTLPQLAATSAPVTVPEGQLAITYIPVYTTIAASKEQRGDAASQQAISSTMQCNNLIAPQGGNISLLYG